MATPEQSDSSPTGPQNEASGTGERPLNERLAYLEGYARGHADAMATASKIVHERIQNIMGRIFSPLTGNRHVTDESEKPF